MIDICCLECKKFTGGCPWHNSSYQISYGYVAGPDKKPYKCPVCDGTGKVSRPPHIAGDISEWVDSQTGPYPCQACEGKGVIWG